MINAVTLLKRKSGLSVSEFQRYWRNEHAAVIARLPGMERYVQSHPLDENYAKREPVCDGFAELWVRDSQALRAISASAAYSAVLADEENFLDRSASTLVVTDEHIVKEGAVSAEGIKRIRFLRRKPGMPVQAFQSCWREQYGPLAATLRSLDRYVQYHTRLGGYAQNRQPAWDGFDMMWFASTGALREAIHSTAAARSRQSVMELPAEDGCPELLVREYEMTG